MKLGVVHGMLATVASSSNETSRAMSASAGAQHATAGAGATSNPTSPHDAAMAKLLGSIEFAKGQLKAAATEEVEWRRQELGSDESPSPSLVQLEATLGLTKVSNTTAQP